MGNIENSIRNTYDAYNQCPKMVIQTMRQKKY